MDRIQWISHKGQRILRLDLSNFTTDEFDRVVEVVQAARTAIDQEPPGSVRLMSDLSGSRYDSRFIELAKRFKQKNKKKR